MIEVRELTKRYGDKTVVDRLSFTVQPGQVTGFLGPNGAGKSTTMRMIIGLDAPTAGSVVVNGRRYAGHPAPLHEIGALLEAKSVHPGHSAVNHLMALARTHGISRRRVEEVIELAGLAGVATKRVGAFSLGMGQRLGIAAALLGDPAVVMLDEPVNGLDPEGVLWVRNLLSRLADDEQRRAFVPGPPRRLLSRRPAHQARPLCAGCLRAHLVRRRLGNLVVPDGAETGRAAHRAAPHRRARHLHRPVTRPRPAAAGLPEWGVRPPSVSLGTSGSLRLREPDRHGPASLLEQRPNLLDDRDGDIRLRFDGPSRRCLVHLLHCLLERAGVAGGIEGLL
ncbi:ATP-binding cassette domain-containing protein [Streptomyces sp. NPDC020996]|uniref:ATP-binding cassette domain-containing protein n=1 Tax=Streptomyces sp. NPDC020996 TaxID=3154791 RepID=UPI0033CCBA29